MRREPDFEESADMRLVELQRASLGVPAPDLSAWKTSVSAEGASVDAEGTQHLASAVLALEVTANPPGDVIPGAIVTIAVSLSNEGALPARNVRLIVPLPGGAAYRNGSLVRDGRPVLDEAAEELFGAGLQLGEILPRSRATLVWKIGVRLGNKPLVIAPTATAQESATIGARALVISRKDAPSNFAATVEQFDRAQREVPIYELDEEEIVEYEAGTAALCEYPMPTEAPVPSTPPPSQPEPYAPPPDQPETPFTPEQPPDPEPSIPVQPEEPPVIEPAARTGVVLYGHIDRPSVTYFDRIFNGAKAPTLLSHFVLGGALACTQDAGGGDPAQLEQHMQAQRQLLQRAALHEKLGKKEPIGQYTGTMLAAFDRLQPQDVHPPTANDRNVILFENELTPPALAVVRRMQDDAARWDFTKARQVTLALQAQRVIAQAPDDALEAAGAALRGYAQTAATQLQRFFVRMRLDRTTGLLFTSDETLDASARRLIASLKALF